MDEATHACARWGEGVDSFTRINQYHTPLPSPAILIISESPDLIRNTVSEGKDQFLQRKILMKVDALGLLIATCMEHSTMVTATTASFRVTSEQNISLAWAARTSHFLSNDFASSYEMFSI